MEKNTKTRKNRGKNKESKKYYKNIIISKKNNRYLSRSGDKINKTIKCGLCRTTIIKNDSNIGCEKINECKSSKNHCFHRQCVQDWRSLGLKRKCPKCK